MSKKHNPIKSKTRVKIELPVKPKENTEFSDPSLSLDKHGVPVKPGCIVITEDQGMGPDIMIVTDVRSGSMIGVMLASVNPHDDQPIDLDAWGTSTAECNNAVVISRDIQEDAEEINKMIGRNGPRDLRRWSADPVEQATTLLAIFHLLHDRYDQANGSGDVVIDQRIPKLLTSLGEDLRTVLNYHVMKSAGT